MTLSNNYIHWEVRSLKDLRGSHCGFAVVQALPPTLGEPERVFFLQRNGWWIERAFHFSLPPKDRASVMFASLSEIAQLSHELGAQAKVVPSEQFLTSFAFSQASSDTRPRRNLTG